MKALISAVKLLTILPIDTRNRIGPGRPGLMLVCFPLVGILLGGLCAGTLWAADQAFPPDIAAALAILALVVATGALHVDGLADTADGVFGGATRERRLEIMRDSRAGTFGVVAVVFLLVLKVLALAATTPTSLRLGAAFMMPVVGRCSILLAAGMCSYAREEEGTGQATIDAARLWHFLIWLPVILLLGWSSLNVAGLPMLIVVLPIVLILILYIRWKLGGMTGDTLGAVCELSEVVFLLSFFVSSKLGMCVASMAAG